MILRFQQIQQRIHAKLASSVYGVDSGEDEGLLLDTDDDNTGVEEEEEEEGGDVGETLVRYDEEVAGIIALAASRSV
jgi:hypothetical protein